MDELTSHAFHNRVVNRASAGTVPNDWIFSTVGCFSVRLCVCVSLRWLDGRPVHAASSMITSTWSGRWRGARSDTWQKVKVSWVRTNGEGGGGSSGPAGASFQWNIFHHWLFLLWKWEIRASSGLLSNRSDPSVGVKHPEEWIQTRCRRNVWVCVDFIQHAAKFSFCIKAWRPSLFHHIV